MPPVPVHSGPGRPAWKGSPVVFLALAIAYPALFLVGTNLHLYTGSQLGATGLLLVCLLPLIVGAGVLVSRFLGRLARTLTPMRPGGDDPARVQASVSRFVLVTLAVLLAMLLFYPIIREAYRSKWVGLGLYAGIPPLAGLLAAFLDLELVNAVLGGLILLCLSMAVHSWTRGMSQGRRIRQIQDLRYAPTIRFQTRPNIYLVVLESYNSLEVRKDLYGLDSTPLRGFLQEAGFTYYPGTYANYGFTLASLSSMLLMDHHYLAFTSGVSDGGPYRRILGGDLPNPVLKTLVENGYRIDYSRFPADIYQPGPMLGAVGQNLLQPLELFTGLTVPFHLLRPATWVRQKYFVPLGLPKDQLTTPMPVPPQGSEPVFSLVYSGAIHSLNDTSQFPDEIRQSSEAKGGGVWKLNQINDFWPTTYRRIVAGADATLIREVGQIAAKDPGGIIILAGDHGGWFHRDQWLGASKDPNENLRRNGTTPQEVTRDIFEVFLAIRWPKPHSARILSHANLFREVFSVLAQEPRLLWQEVPNDSYLTRNIREPLPLYATVRSGRPLGRWEMVR